MCTLATTRMSSKRQIVYPDAVRKKVNLQAVVQFVVVGEDDGVILKAITAPRVNTFDMLIQQAHQQVKAPGLKRQNISTAIMKARGRV